MRVNIYAEEMTERIEIIEKEIEGEGKFTGLRFYLELPVTMHNGPPNCETYQAKGSFYSQTWNDDSAAVTFWGKQDLRKALQIAIDRLDRYYGEPIQK